MHATMEKQQTVTKDAWLSAILNRPCFSGIPDAPSAGDFYSTKVNSIDDMLRLTRLGFDLVSIGVLLANDNAEGENDGVRLAEDADRESICTIARTVFIYERFHADRKIATPDADEIKRQWADNFFLRRRGTHMIVAERDGEIAGFNQCIVKDGVLTTDLIGVRADARRHGVGTALMRGAVALTGVTRAQVGTQLENIPSLALYTKLGYSIRSHNFVMHCHG